MGRVAQKQFALGNGSLALTEGEPRFPSSYGASRGPVAGRAARSRAAGAVSPVPAGPEAGDRGRGGAGAAAALTCCVSLSQVVSGDGAQSPPPALTQQP